MAEDVKPLKPEFFYARKRENMPDYVDLCSERWMEWVSVVSRLLWILNPFMEADSMLQEMAVAVASPAPAATGRRKATNFWPPWHWLAELMAAFSWETLTTSGGSSPLGMSPVSWS